MTKDFSVVNFVKDNTSEFVPSKWITTEGEKSFVRFPRVMDTQADALRRDPETLPKACWPKWEISVKLGTNHLEKAERKAEKYRYTSDIDSSCTEAPTKRTRLQTAEQGPSLVLNVPNSSFFATAGLQQSIPTYTTLPVAEGGAPWTTPAVTDQLGFSDFQSVNQEEFNSVIVANYAGDPNLKLLLDEQRAFQEKTLQKLEIVIHNQLEIKSMLLRSISTTTSGEQGEGSFFDFIPIKSLDCLQSLEVCLQERAVQNKLISVISRFARTEISKTIGDILSYLFEVGFSRGVRMTKGSGKIPFGDTKLCDCLRETLLKYHPEFKINDINSKIGAWFRGSIDRGRGRIRRHGNSEANSTSASASGGDGGAEGDPITEANNNAVDEQHPPASATTQQQSGSTI